MRRAFTLIEVNLSVMVMAMGVLGLVSLFSLGYRESRQSSEDVEAAALAERNLNALVTMLSDTNMTWTAWNAIGELPSGSGARGGWGGYFDLDNRKTKSATGLVAHKNPNSTAREVFDKVKQKCSSCGIQTTSFHPGNLNCGLVVFQDGGRCSLSFRAGRRPGAMLFQPVYYTEVFFQGDPTK